MVQLPVEYLPQSTNLTIQAVPLTLNTTTNVSPPPTSSSLLPQPPQLQPLLPSSSVISTDEKQIIAATMNMNNHNQFVEMFIV